MKWQLMVAALGIALTVPAQEAWSYNPPGPAGGAGHGKFWHYNPAGPRGGRGKGWNYNPPGRGRVKFVNYNNKNYGNNCTSSRINPPGPVGGTGHGKFWHYNPAGLQGGRGQGWVYNPPGPGQTRFY